MNRKIFAFVVALILIVPSPLTAQQVTAIRAARMIDVTSAKTISDAVVVVRDDRIFAVGPAAMVSIPQGARVIDLGDVTLLPGFIDAHTHITGRTLGDPMKDLEVVKDYQGYGAIMESTTHSRHSEQGSPRFALLDRRTSTTWRCGRRSLKVAFQGREWRTPDT